MRKDSLLTLTALALVLTLGGCSKDDDAVTGNDGIIRFGVSEFPESRAAINSADDFKIGNAFDVWGYYTSPTAGKIDVFKGENGSGIPVTKSNTGWGYAGGDRYWVKEMPYTFYAVYPSELGKLSEDGNTITIDNFNCSATGDDAIDLMTANTNISYSTEQSPQPVALQFSHELARLKFTVKVENEVTATVTGAKLYGVVYQGNYSSANKTAWTPVASYSESNTTFVYNPTNPQPLTTDGINVFPDILIIPNEDIEDAIFELTYYYDEYSQVPVTKKIKVKTTSIPGWTKGQSYSYMVTIGPNNIQFQPVVTPWNTSTGGIITVE